MIITVVGRRQESRAPELAVLSLRLAFEAEDAGEAMAELTREAARLTDEIAELRAADPSPTWASTVQAPGTRSWRPWSNDGTELPLRHEAALSATVTFRDFAALSDCATRWGGRSGWSLQGVEWTLTEPVRADLERAALEGAVADARTRAETIAAASGAGQVTVLDVADPGLLAHTAEGGQIGAGMMVRAMAKGGGDGEGVAIAPEDVRVEVVLHARFEA